MFETYSRSIRPCVDQRFSKVDSRVPFCLAAFYSVAFYPGFGINLHEEITTKAMQIGREGYAGMTILSSLFIICSGVARVDVTRGGN